MSKWAGRRKMASWIWAKNKGSELDYSPPQILKDIPLGQQANSIHSIWFLKPPISSQWVQGSSTQPSSSSRRATPRKWVWKNPRSSLITSRSTFLSSSSNLITSNTKLLLGWGKTTKQMCPLTANTPTSIGLFGIWKCGVGDSSILQSWRNSVKNLDRLEQRKICVNWCSSISVDGMRFGTISTSTKMSWGKIIYRRTEWKYDLFQPFYH